MQSDQALYCCLTQFHVLILISLKIIMNSSKNRRWIVSRNSSGKGVTEENMEWCFFSLHSLFSCQILLCGHVKTLLCQSVVGIMFPKCRWWLIVKNYEYNNYRKCFSIIIGKKILLCRGLIKAASPSKIASFFPQFGPKNSPFQ